MKIQQTIVRTTGPNIFVLTFKYVREIVYTGSRWALH